MTWLVAAGGVGGLLILLTFVIAVGRGVFRQVNATEDNTAAVKELTSKINTIMAQLNGHETRIAVLEERTKQWAPRGRPTTS